MGFLMRLALGIGLLLIGAGPVRSQARDSTINGKTLQQWLREVKSRDDGVAVTAIQAVRQFGKNVNREAGPVLISRLNERDVRDVSVRVYAALAIGEIGLDPGDLRNGVTALMHAARYDPEAIVRYHAIIALGRLKTDAKPAIPILVNAIRDRASVEIRQAAALALGTLGLEPNAPPDRRALTALIDALAGPKADRCSRVRLEAAQSLVRLGAPALPADRQVVVHALATALEDPDKGVTIWARVALMRMNGVDPVHLKRIVDLLQSKDLSVRIQAAQALGVMGNDAKPAVPYLIQALRDKEPDGAAAAALALQGLENAITAKDVVELAKLLTDRNVQTRCQAARTLGLLGARAKAHVADLVQLLRDPDEAVVVAAAAALGDMGSVGLPALDALDQLATHKKEKVRVAAAAAIDRIRNRDRAAPARDLER